MGQGKPPLISSIRVRNGFKAKLPSYQGGESCLAILNFYLCSSRSLNLPMSSTLNVKKMNRAAGFPIHILGWVGAASMMLASTFRFADVLSTKTVVLDPSWVVAKVVPGIVFLGADGPDTCEIVRGLATVASRSNVQRSRRRGGHHLYHLP